MTKFSQKDSSADLYMEDSRYEQPSAGPVPSHRQGTRIKVVSLWQPWAEAMRRGVKQNETRSWPTRYRGWLAIHAAKKPIDMADWGFVDFAQYWIGDFSKLTFGAILCVVRLVDCVRTETVLENLSEHEELWGDYDEGRWAWQTDQLVTLPSPIPLRGRQGLFDWEPTAEIEAMLGKGTPVTRFRSEKVETSK